MSVDGSEHRFREIVADFPIKGILECEYTSSRLRSYSVLCSDSGRIADIRAWFSHSQFFRGWKERRTLSLRQLAVIRQILKGDPLQPELENTGIVLLLDPREGAQPGAVMEYDPNKKVVQMRIYGKEDPDGEPVCLLPMSGTED